MSDSIKLSAKARLFILILFGTLAAGFIQGSVLALVSVNNYDLSGCSTLTDPESIAREWYLASLILIGITLMTAVLLFLKRGVLKILSIGIFISLFLPIIIFLRIYPDYNNREKYYEEFDADQWRKATYKPLRMARWMDRNSFLQNKTGNEVKTLLGTPESVSASGYYYNLEIPGTVFRVNFDNDLVTGDTIVCNW